MKVGWRDCGRIGVTVVLVALCIMNLQGGMHFLGAVLGAMFPLMIGGIAAYIVNILMSFLERHFFRKTEIKIIGRLRRPVCMILSYLLVLLVTFMVVLLVAPELTGALQILIARLPAAVEELLANDQVEELLPKLTEKLAAIDWNETINSAVRFVQDNVWNVAGSTISAVTTVFSSVVTFLIGIIFSMYILLGKDRLGVQGKMVLRRYLPEKWNERILRVLSVLDANFHRFIVGQCTEAVILGALCAAGMLIFRFPYAAMIGVLVGFTALIPVVGAYLGAIVGMFMMLTVSVEKAILFLIFIVVLQQLEGNLIYPRVVGNSIGLPALWVLAAVTVGGSLGGIVGMLAGVPLAATVYQIIRSDVHGQVVGQEPDRTVPREARAVSPQAGAALSKGERTSPKRGTAPRRNHVKK